MVMETCCRTALVAPRMYALKNIESIYHSHDLHQNPLEHLLPNTLKLHCGSVLPDQVFCLVRLHVEGTAAYYDINVDATVFQLIEREAERATDG